MSEIVPFGKYRGQPVEVLAADRDYCDWLAAQPWFRERFGSLHTLIINNFVPQISDTPEHNAMQARFLNSDYCLRLAWHIGLTHRMAEREAKAGARELSIAIKNHASTVKNLQEIIKIAEENDFSEWRNRRVEEAKDNHDQAVIRLNEAVELCNKKIRMKCSAIAFEEKGWDVVLSLKLVERMETYYASDTIWLELKPTLGDDYPAVLRQMKTNFNLAKSDIRDNYFIIITDSIIASGASVEAVKSIFRASGFLLIVSSELDQADAVTL